MNKEDISFLGNLTATLSGLFLGWLIKGPFGVITWIVSIFIFIWYFPPTSDLNGDDLDDKI